MFYLAQYRGWNGGWNRWIGSASRWNVGICLWCVAVHFIDLQTPNRSLNMTLKLYSCVVVVVGSRQYLWCYCPFVLRWFLDQVRFSVLFYTRLHPKALVGPSITAPLPFSEMCPTGLGDRLDPLAVLQMGTTSFCSSTDFMCPTVFCTAMP